MTVYTTRQFRAKLKEALDAVEAGVEIRVVRGGRTFKLSPYIRPKTPAVLNEVMTTFIPGKFCSKGHAVMGGQCPNGCKK